MNQIFKALLLATGMIGLAVLAVFDIVPAQVAQFAPLVLVPFVVARQGRCRVRQAGQRG